MTTRRKGVVLVLGFVALAGALAPAASQQPDPNKALAQAQLKLAREALNDLDRLYKGGETSRDNPKFSLWWRREVDAIRASGAEKAELVTALERYVERMRGWARDTELAYKRDVRPHIDLIDVQYRVLEAEIWLNQEKAR
ncbi:hypothetical protein SAMN05444166_3576 [Singulisphaera sp. GP187]|uniref:hypothetical protein n=1 Tax=Singulisphaera sp. GP187 TaxID=1882752 RepID=UPI0009271879|nr:hypothetical protein [Singulisphaera sp. GP187]SIO29642.1 hypothetical protein SAMN05444166_3576 [Singulisphaera sp. GP187]